MNSCHLKETTGYTRKLMCAVKNRSLDLSVGNGHVRAHDHRLAPGAAARVYAFSSDWTYAGFSGKRRAILPVAS